MPAYAQSAAHTITLSSNNALTNPYYYEGWIPRELIAQQYVDEIVPAVCQGGYVPVFDHFGAKGELNLQADSVIIDQKKISYLRGNVEGITSDMRFFAEEVQVDHRQDLIFFKGKVRFYHGELFIEGNEGVFDNATGEFSIENVSYVQPSERVRLHTNLLTRDQAGVFRLEKASYTTCEPGRNDWRLYGRSILLDYAAGWGQVTHAVLYIGTIPVFYFPWFRFPLSDKRQSGFLLPKYTSNNTNGSIVSIPFYVNLAPNYDLTLVPSLYEKRGLLLETEARLLTSYGESSLTNTTLDDAIVQKSRHSIGLSHTGGVGLPWRTSIAYQRAGDANYYKDLEFTILRDKTNLLNQNAEVSFARDSLRFDLGAFDYQPLSGYTSRIYASVPRANISYLTRGRRLGLSLLSNYNYFIPRRLRPYSAAEIASGQALEGERLHTVIMPGVYFRSASGELAFITRHIFTDYNLQKAGATPTHQSYGIHSGIIRGNLIFDRLTHVLGRSYTQTLTLDSQLLATQNIDQSDAPVFTTSEPRFTYSSVFALNRFEGFDKVGDTKQLSYGLSTSILNTNNTEIFTFKIGQIYYAEQRFEQLGKRSRASEDNIRYNRTFSPIATRTSFMLPQSFQLHNDLVWDQRIGRNLLNSFLIKKHLSPRSFFAVGYNLVADEIAHTSDSVVETEQINLSGVLQATPHLALFGRSFYDQKKLDFIEQLGGLEYESCCWRITFGQFQRTNFNEVNFPKENGFFIQFRLKGLMGSVGKSGKARLGEISTELEKAIPGYNQRPLYLPD